MTRALSGANGRPGAAIAIVDDEDDLRGAVEEYLAGHGFTVSAHRDARSFREAAAAGFPDVAILDIAMPGEDGVSLARWIRASSDAGLIFATASGKPIDRIIGMEAGADDFIVKPYSLRELLARVKSILRRLPETREAPQAPAGAPEVAIAFGDCRFIPSRNLLLRGGAPVELSAAESAILELFATRPGRLLTRSDIASALGKADTGPRAIDTAILRLRRKIEDDPTRPRHLVTLRGEGYQFHGVAT